MFDAVAMVSENYCKDFHIDIFWKEELENILKKIKVWQIGKYFYLFVFL